jgi:hypothetical protein
MKFHLIGTLNQEDSKFATGSLGHGSCANLKNLLMDPVFEYALP